MIAIKQFIRVSPNRMQCKCGEIMRDYQTEDHKCATQAEQAYKARQAEADALRQAWHDALIAECGFKIGDIVILPDAWVGYIISLYVKYSHEGILLFAKVGKQNGSCGFIERISRCTRIDEHGNPLPPREKGEA